MEVKAYGLFIEIPGHGMALQFPVHATHVCAKKQARDVNQLMGQTAKAGPMVLPLVLKADADAAIAEANSRYDARENEAHELSEKIINYKRLIIELNDTTVQLNNRLMKLRSIANEQL